MNNNNNIALASALATLGNAFEADPIGTGAQLYVLIGRLEKHNVETGLNRKSLVATTTSSQSKTNAMPGLIVDKANSTGSAVLSPLGKAVMQLPSFAASFDVDKHRGLEFVADKEEAKLAKAEAQQALCDQFGITKLKKGVGKVRAYREPLVVVVRCAHMAFSGWHVVEYVLDLVTPAHVVVRLLLGLVARHDPLFLVMISHHVGLAHTTLINTESSTRSSENSTTTWCRRLSD